MRLRSIPSRTMATLIAKRAGPNGSAWSIRPQRHLPGPPRGSRDVRTTDGRLCLGVLPAGLRQGQIGFGPTPRHGAPGRHGRIYCEPSVRRRPIDLLIPPRSGPGRRPVTQMVSATPEAHVVRIEFPTLAGPEEIRWDLHGDVLEVEYLGQAFTYYHAFLVPAEIQPSVEQRGCALSFHFPKGTKG